MTTLTDHQLQRAEDIFEAEGKATKDWRLALRAALTDLVSREAPAPTTSPQKTTQPRSWPATVSYSKAFWPAPTAPWRSFDHLAGQRPRQRWLAGHWWASFLTAA